MYFICFEGDWNRLSYSLAHSTLHCIINTFGWLVRVDSCQCVGNCTCKCQEVAGGIYRKFEAHQQVANTLARQGKHRAVIEYGRTKSKAILESNPTIFYAIMLLQSNLNSRKTECSISFCCIVNILLTNKQWRGTYFISWTNCFHWCYDSERIKHSISDLIFQENLQIKLLLRNGKELWIFAVRKIVLRLRWKFWVHCLWDKLWIMPPFPLQWTIFHRAAR